MKVISLSLRVGHGARPVGSCPIANKNSGRWVVGMIIPESTMYHTLHSIYVACIMILCYSPL